VVVALKKSDLYSSLWRSCDELRGGMDASQYKDYILTLLFVKYVSDKQKSDKQSLIDVPSGGSFDDMVALKGDKEIGDKINKIIGKLAEANGLEKVIDLADFNDEERLGKGKEMQDRLSKLVTIFADLDFRGSKAEGDDLLGDAYEYLMRHFATESGKSKGQFYTPAEVSRILAKIVGIGPNTRQDQTVYDPTCGSGSLLLKVAAETPRGITVYGQEKDNATWALAKMNMILHANEDADIRKGDTITNPQFTKENELRTFDFAVANPPFSVKSWSNGLENDYGRFEFGRPPVKNGDYAFLLHILKSLKSTGKAAVILPHGTLFRGNAEADIRRQLLKRGYIKGVIGLPANLFYGTGIPACILVLDKEDAAARSSVFMIDASKGFVKDGPKNRLRSQDIHKIVDVFNKQIEIDRYSRIVPLSEIASIANDFNLNIPRYIDSSDPQDIQDLDAHLHGGIPDRDIDALGAYWNAFPQLRASLFNASDRPGYCELAIDVTKVQQAILDSSEFRAFSADVLSKVSVWFVAHRPALESITGDSKPNDLIAAMGDDLLTRFKTAPLLDEYDVYERLMAYWHETMHDDIFLIMNEGWVDSAKPRKTVEDKDRKISETPDIVIGSGRKADKYKTDLIPPDLVVVRYFSDQQAAVDRLTTAVDDASRAIDEYVEEHAVEDGLLAEAMDDGKVTKALATARLKDARQEGSDLDEIKALQHVIELFEAESAAKKAGKEAQVALDLNALHRYAGLTETEIKQLILDDKWLATITGRIASELNALTLALVARIEELGDRYGKTLAKIDAAVERLSARVAEHLAGDEGPSGTTQTFRLKELGATYGGLTGKSKPDFGQGRARYVTFLEVINNVRLRGRHLEAVRVAKGENQNRVQGGDVLFNASSETPEEVALSAVVDFEPDTRTFLNSFCFGYRLRREDIVDPTYLAYFFRSFDGRKLIAALAQGATRYNIAKTKFLELRLELPPIDTQRLIVERLSCADDLTATLKQLATKRRAMAQGMLQKLMTSCNHSSVEEQTA
jgi:type I restriction enzyme M protein